MRMKFIPIIIMLLAGFTACIITYLYQYDILDSLIIILIILITFYIIGFIIAKIVAKFLVVEKKIPEGSDELNKNSTVTVETDEK